MPRDLESERATLENLPPLSTAPRIGSPPISAAPSDPIDIPQPPPTSLNLADGQMEGDPGDKIMLDLQREDSRSQLHPYAQTLTVSDVDSCTRLEAAAFAEGLRCTREKFHYRLSTCSELSLGLFSSVSIPSSGERAETLEGEIAAAVVDAPTAPTAHAVESSAPDRKAVLLALACATKSANMTVQDSDMAMPKPGDGTTVGHNEAGRTICLHSLAVLPEFQAKGLGSTLLKDFIQRMEGAGAGDRIAIITFERLVPWYERHGFRSLGRSEATFGGEVWYDMVRELRSQSEQRETSLHRFVDEDASIS